jgi:uncharacterized membrane protein
MSFEPADDDEDLGTSKPSMFRYLLERSAEIFVAILGTAVAGITLWLCYDFVVSPKEGNASWLTLLAVLYAMTFVALALLLFSARLLVPRLRPGGSIIGSQGMAAFAVLYVIMLVIGLAHGTVEAKRGGLAILLGVTIVIAWRSAFGRRS